VRALVLSSTQPRHPASHDAWVRATVHAIEQLAKADCEFICSTGTAPWELALWKASACGAPVHLVDPLAASLDERLALARVTEDFALRTDRTTAEFVRAGTRLKDAWPQRDARTLALADRIVPISIRAGGRLEAMIAARELRERCDDAFRVDYDSTPHKPVWAGLQPHPRALEWPVGPTLLHMTRCSQGPWPGERRHTYYEALANGTAGDPRDALATLQRIVREQCVRGSSFRIRGAGKAVSLTGLEPTEALRLVRWRSRYARYSFEPYGIAVSVQAARRLGARPVAYDAGATEPAPGHEPILCQGRGAAGHWERECEWRVAGDFDLAALADHEAVVWTATDDEASQARSWCRFQVASFGYRAA